MKITTVKQLQDLIKAEAGAVVKDIVEERMAHAEEEFKARADGAVTAAMQHEAKTKDEKDTKTQRAGKMLRCLALANGDKDQAIRHAKDAGLEGTVKALSTLAGGSGGYLVTPEIGEFIDALGAGSAVRSLNARIIPMPNGAISLPGANTGATANWVGENETAGSSAPGDRMVTMTAKKLMVVVPLSNELLEDTSGLADRWVEEEAKRASEEAEDLAFIRGAGSSNSPKGIYHRVYASNLFNITHAAAAATAPEVYADVGRLIRKQADQNIPMVRNGFIFSKRTEWFLKTLLTSFTVPLFASMDKGVLFGFPFASTTQIPNNLSVVGSADESEMYLADFQTSVIGEAGGSKMQVVNGAAYYDTDSSAVVSGLSNDQTVVTVMRRVDFTSLHSGKDQAVLKAVDWGA